MNFRGKKILIASQVVIILAFFAGMMLNYYTLRPVIDEGETYRLTTQIDDYCTVFYPDRGCDTTNVRQMDSLAAFDPYSGGDVFVMDSDARILYSRDGETGDAYEVIAAKYGDLALDLLKSERQTSEGRSRMEYEAPTYMSLYASYDSARNLLFFYAIDYRLTGNALSGIFLYLLIFMIAGGVVVILICSFIAKIFFTQFNKESQTQQELSTAAVIQKSMLPRGEKQMIQLDVNARLLPARKVGGDFYCYLLRDGLLYFCIGDVSGKGVPASLFMSKAVTLFRSLASSQLPVKEIAMKMNAELCYNNDQNMFLTGILGTIRAYDGYVIYVNAGHEPPVIWDGNAESGLTYLESEGSVPFGVMNDVDFVIETHEIGKGGLMLLYTDGISEARSKSDGLLGRSRLLSLLEEVKGCSSKEINSHLLNAIAGFESGMEQSDDITLLTFRNTPNPKQLVIKNDIRELSKIAPFMQSIYMECALAPDDHILVRSGLDEALTNCVHYAYDSPGNEIEISASIEDSRLCFTIRDSGKPFNPLEYKSEPMSGELKIGGLGISIYKANFDDVEYERTNKFNILKLIKNL